MTSEPEHEKHRLLRYIERQNELFFLLIWWEWSPHHCLTGAHRFKKNYRNETKGTTQKKTNLRDKQLLEEKWYNNSLSHTTRWKSDINSRNNYDTQECFYTATKKEREREDEEMQDFLTNRISFLFPSISGGNCLNVTLVNPSVILAFDSRVTHLR